ncbi:MAG TPA: anthranilate synthase component I family protein [Sedimentisphaerales bacterium]|nr:anthranilate synthase component I family protein [Sedimentisphaerales bacterium]
MTSCIVRFRSIDRSVSFPQLNETFGGICGAVILGGNDCDTTANRFSYWMAEPREVLDVRAEDDRPLERLAAALARYRLEEGGRLPADGIFSGGWAGCFSYDLGRFIEKIPQTAKDDLRMPVIRLGFYDKLICWDRLAGRGWMIALQVDGENVESKFVWLQRRLSEASAARAKIWPPAVKTNLAKLRSNMTREHYSEALARIRKYIWDGEFYQINFSQRFERPFRGRAIDIFQWQGRYNPCPYAAFVDADTFKVVSASMEMFVTINGGRIWTRPIKGTRPRVAGDEAANSKNRRELEDSAKEQAELNMIIDLERNDLGRICDYGSIKVEQPRSIEEYPTVFHALATVGGRLREGVSFCDVLRAMFPGGSITGAPKIRAMEAIEELEPTRRGLYTGSIGYIGLDGNVCLNIAIRTIIISGGVAYAQSGGGIVADSVPQAEWDETLTKVMALAAGLEAAEQAS